MPFVPIAAIAVGTIALLVSGRPALKIGMSQAAGLSFGLCAIALAVALIPHEWRIWLGGHGAGDPLLTFFRGVGLTGLIFLAGTRFHPEDLPRVWRISFLAVALNALGGVVMVLLLTVDPPLTLTGVVPKAGITGAFDPPPPPLLVAGTE